MKKLSTLFMALVILFGLVLALTPIIGSIFFPQPEVSTQMAKSDVARSALARWFNAPVAAFVDVRAIRQTTKQATNKKSVKSSLSRFSFSTPPDVVRAFIGNKKLEQKSLSNEIMQQIFADNTISWWQPDALGRETWFNGTDQGRMLSLIYNAQTERGVLVIESSTAPMTQTQQIQEGK